MKYGPGKNPNSHIHSQKSKEKISETLKKRHIEKKWGWGTSPPWNKGLTGFQAGIPRHAYNEEFRKKISETSMGRIPWNKGLNKDEDKRLANVSYMLKINNPTKIQGVTKKYIRNNTKNHFEFRENILKRDNYICCICGKEGNNIHHIDYDNFNDTPQNTITICRECHAKTNWNRKYWKSYLTQYLNTKYNYN
jgi:hypothetical protein